MFKTIKNAFKTPEIRKRLMYTLLLIVIFRLGCFISVPGVDTIALQKLTTGAQNDIARATKIATRMVTEFGMSDKIGTLALEKDSEEVFLGRDISRTQKHSDKTNELIDDEIKAIIIKAKDTARKILEENRDKLDNLVKYLIEKETLTGEEVDKIMKGEPLELREEEPINVAQPEIKQTVQEEKPEVKVETKEIEQKQVEPEQEQVKDKEIKKEESAQQEQQVKAKKTRKKEQPPQNDLFA